MAVSLTHSHTRAHTDMDTSHTPWRATPSPAATLTSRPLSSPRVLGARATGAGAAQSPEPRNLRVRPSGSCEPPRLGGRGVGWGPEMGLGLRPGVGTGGVWLALCRRSCRHPPPRWVLTGFPAWEGSARKSEASGDRGHLLLGHKCPKRRWGWEDVPVSETPLPDVSTRRRACLWTAGQYPCSSSRQR